MQRKTAPIGPISSGTMREEDLIPVFADWLEDLDSMEEYKELVSESRAWLEWEEGDETPGETDEHQEQGGGILGDLFDALDAFSPEYCYFGAHEGDGSCYGWWISSDSLEDDCRYGEVLKVSDLAEVAEDYTGTVLLVNDHGNWTLYSFTNGESREVWSVVWSVRELRRKYAHHSRALGISRRKVLSRVVPRRVRLRLHGRRLWRLPWEDGIGRCSYCGNGIRAGRRPTRIPKDNEAHQVDD